MKHNAIVKNKEVYLDGVCVALGEVYKIHIYFNGKRMSCIEADEREQTIVVHKRDAHGRYVFDDKKKIVTERIAGDVRITFEE